jgi:hypothetical protein
MGLKQECSRRDHHHCSSADCKYIRDTQGLDYLSLSSVGARRVKRFFNAFETWAFCEQER